MGWTFWKLVVGALLGLLAIPAAAVAAGQTFVYTGHPESYSVPAGVHYVHIEAGGGKGGSGHTGGKGGLGIQIDAHYVPVKPGDTLRVVVGGDGGTAGGGGKLPNTGEGGYNGGADGARGGGGGGGFTYVQESDGSHLIVAGGGGGGGAGANGGPQNPPGTLNGQNGGGSLGTPQGGGGGTLTAGGYGGHNASPLVGDGKGGGRWGGGAGGNGLSPKGSSGGGGGGGGWFGGGGGAGSETGSGGGGGAGSSYVAPDVRLVTATHTGAAQVTITPEAEASAHALQVDVPTTMDAGTAYDVTITAVDAAGVRASDYRGTVHLTSSTPGALASDYAFTTADAGQHTFRGGARFLKAGPLSVTATDVGVPATTGTASGLQVRPRGLKSLTITPTRVIASRPTAFHAEGFDEFGNDLGDFSNQATFRIIPEAGCTQAPPVCTARLVDEDRPYHLLTAAVGTVVGKTNLTVSSKVASTVTVHADPERGALGAASTFTATVANSVDQVPQPTGSVTFFDGSTQLGSAPLTAGAKGATATLTTRALKGGDHTISAAFDGDSANRPSRGELSYRVLAQATTTTIIPTANPAPTGTNPGFRVAVRTDAATPAMVDAGRIVVIADGDQAQRLTVDAGDLAKPPVTFPKPLGPGDHIITAAYLGTDDHQASHASLVQTVRGDGTATSVAVSTSDATPEVDEPITLSAVVSTADGPVQGGSVSFVVDGRPFASAVAVHDGRATSPQQVPAIGLGAHEVVANYLPATGLAPSSAKLPGGIQTQPAVSRMTIASSAAHVDPGGPISFTATVSTRWQPAQGRVQFAIDGQPLGDRVGLADGTATIRVRPGSYGDRLTPGTHLITAGYLPFDGRTRPSDADLRQQVGPAQTTTTTVGSSDGRSEWGQAVTFTAVVAADGDDDTPTGTVQFSVDGVALGDPVALDGGRARSAPVSGLGVGEHRITAHYAGRGFDYAASDGVLERQVVTAAATQTSLTSSQNPWDRGQPGTAPQYEVRVSAANGTPTGTIDFRLDTFSTTVPLVDGQATVVLPSIVVYSTLDIGLHPVRAVFHADSNRYVDSSDTLDQIVKK
jgi:hypothetical protein